MEVSSTPNHIRNSDVSAIAGIKRNRLRIGSMIQRNGLKCPTTSPIGTAITTASPQPFSTRLTDAAMSAHSVPLLTSSLIAAQVSAGLGRKISSYCKDPSPQNRKTISQETIPVLITFKGRSQLPVFFVFAFCAAMAFCLLPRYNTYWIYPVLCLSVLLLSYHQRHTSD